MLRWKACPGPEEKAAKLTMSLSRVMPISTTSAFVMFRIAVRARFLLWFFNWSHVLARTMLVPGAPTSTTSTVVRTNLTPN